MARDYELKMKQLEFQNKNSSVRQFQPVEARSIKIPHLNENDDIEVYLTTFERIATANKWEKVSWAPRLATLLTGKATESFVRMDINDVGDYDKLKAVILARYNLTPEVYRKKI